MIDVVDAARAAPREGKISVYYAVCWTNFSGEYPTLYAGGTNCGYKVWINRSPYCGCPTISSYAISHGSVGAKGVGVREMPRKDWNEVLIKVVVDPEQIPSPQVKKHTFFCSVRQGKDAFGWPASKAQIEYTNQPPPD
jgi:hypothetical protein